MPKINLNSKPLPWVKKKKPFEGANSNNFKQFYNSTAWKKIRKAVLWQEPLCRMCDDKNETTAATEVDHIVPLTEDWSKRLDRANLQALCSRCHQAKTAKEIRARQA
jgi:5-methylcytosine-specific restriction protein A